VIAAKHSPYIVVTENLGVSSPANSRAQRLFGIAGAQMIFELGFKPDSRRRVSFAVR
jgi:hypothetical protein